MTDGEQEPDSDVEMDEIEAAEKRYDEAPPENREAAWLELWHARDFTWRGRSKKAALQTEMVEVPASFPNGREAEGEFKTVSLQDYWRWSIGLPGEERLLTDEEMREAGLLVEVDGEIYHIIHAPDMDIKGGEHGMPLQILTDIIAARGKCVPEDIGTDADGNPSFTRALQLLGGWLPGALPQHACTETAVQMSGARVSDIDISGLEVGPLKCHRSLFKGVASFNRATFSGDAGFREATFSGYAGFDQATFSGEADFWHVTFSGEADFWHVTFSGYAGFDQATFSGKAHFMTATFIGRADFMSATFSGKAGFESATFSRDAHFMTATFIGRADFMSATFSGKASFYQARFSGAGDFVSATFSGEASFSQATFSGWANFEKATFRNWAHFESATLKGEASFYQASFSGWANFEKATFGAGLNFESATLKGKASFSQATFGLTSFGNTTFSGVADFEKATFGDRMTFEKCTCECAVNFKDVQWSDRNRPNAFRSTRFKDRVDFEADTLISVSAFNEAHFEIPPSFTDRTQSQLNQIFGDAVKQTYVSIRQGYKDKPKASCKERRAIKDKLLAALEGGFRTLKKVAEEKGNFLLSQTYYRFEVRTRVKRPEIAFWEKVAATIYGLSSDYGNSIARPFVSLAVTLAGFAAIYLALAIEVNLVDWQDRAALQSGLFQSIEFSLTNVFRPLSALSPDASGEAEVSRLSVKLLRHSGEAFGLIVTAISIVQSLTGIVLAFLFGLAVRRRFQIS